MNEDHWNTQLPAVLAAWSWWKAWGRLPLRLEPALVADLIRRSSLLFFIWIAVQLVTVITMAAYVHERGSEPGPVT